MEGSATKRVGFFFNLANVEESEQQNGRCLATNKNWPPHLFCIWGPIMCELKGETPQEGINCGADWRQGQVWRPDGRETTTVVHSFVGMGRVLEDGTALDR